MDAITYICRFCLTPHPATTADLAAARGDEAEAMRYDGDLRPSGSDTELMDRFGRDICDECAPPLPQTSAESSSSIDGEG